jgi:hypothetical protein
MMFQILRPLKKDRLMSEEEIVEWDKLPEEDFEAEKGRLLRNISQPEPIAYKPLSDEAKTFDTKRLKPQEFASYTEAMLKGPDSTAEWVRDFEARKAAKKEGR